MVSTARLGVVKQSFFGLPGQYGRRVTRANSWGFKQTILCPNMDKNKIEAARGGNGNCTATLHANKEIFELNSPGLNQSKTLKGYKPLCKYNTQRIVTL